ncbi:hypothetical protein [Nocardioides speluncae]|uniref:hypothetical protein n=1 Tax=Nocardioides speluncae TaxID=2670337 RepID=UPI000D69FCFF|nr:hypothetical protein [Nocardioides speluncae]
MLDPVAQVQSQRRLAWSLLVAPIAIVVAMWFALTEDRLGDPARWALVAVLVAAAFGAALIEVAGYRFAPISPGTPSDAALRTALVRTQTRMILRYAAAELALLVSLALAFIVEEGGFWLVLGGAALSIALMLLHVVPNARNIGRSQAALERSGAVVPLQQLFNA